MICTRGDEEPMTIDIFCAGICGKKIEEVRRFVCDPSLQYAWCLACYENLPDLIQTVTGVICKSSLIVREWKGERGVEVGNDDNVNDNDDDDDDDDDDDE